MQLRLAILVRKMLEILGCVVAFAEAHVHPGSFHLHFDVVPLPIAFDVRADVVAQQVVAAVVCFHTLERIAQITQIEERLPAGIRRKRGQRVARILPAIHLFEHRSAGERRIAVRRTGGGIAARNFRHQSARVHGIDGYVGAVGGIGGRAKLSAILFPGLGNPAGELDHRFFPRDRGEDVRQALHRGELFIGVEDVELGFIRGVSRAGVFADVGFTVGGRGVVVRGELRFHSRGERLDGGSELFAIVGEIFQHFQGVCVHHYAHQVRGAHALLHES